MKLDLSYDIPWPSENKNCQMEFKTNLRSLGHNKIPLFHNIIHHFLVKYSENIHQKASSIKPAATLNIVNNQIFSKLIPGKGGGHASHSIE